MQDVIANDMHMRFFCRTEQAWEAMYRDCMDARTSIDFEQYIIMDDVVGRRFLSLFAQKAADGVRVRLMLDGVGSRAVLAHRHVAAIRAAGGQVEFFNPLRWRNLFTLRHWLPRNHVKTLMVDGAVVHTGSVCLRETMQDWHDLHVRFTGPAVDGVRRDFTRTWQKDVDAPPPVTDPDLRYVVSMPHLHPSPLYHELLDRVEAAERHIRIVTPYFLPPRRLRRSLRAAAQRGASVEVVMSAKTDVALADLVSRSYFPWFLEGGISLYLYPHEVLHAKYVMIDDDWATVGSMNVDYLSLLVNREANLVMHHPQAVAALRDISDAYLRDSRQVDMGYWRDIPAMHKGIGYMGRYVRQVL